MTIKELPILFSGAMIRAILEGRKTQTRRIVKRPSNVSDDAIPEPLLDGNMFWKLPDYNVGNSQKCPYGEVGDRLWVRETWLQSPVSNQYWYRADKGEEDFAAIYNYRWKPSIHMPRAASRITIEIVGIRLERLQDISEQDAIAEGISSIDDGGEILYLANSPSSERQTRYSSSVAAFRKLWDSINRDRGYSWDSNPFVWVVEFKKLGASSTQQLEESCNG